jgi:hypothetical protein
MLDKNGKLHELVESTIYDIFRKFDLLLAQELTFNEFQALYEMLDKKITQKEFEVNILNKYASTNTGITLQGFIDFFKDIIKTVGE